MNSTYENLVNYLNERTREYDEGHPGISDAEWDKWYFTLVEMERESGFIHPDSPSHKIVYQVVNELKKIKHNHPMLSLEKTKSIDEIKEFINSKLVSIMCKMDGLTCSLHYKDGRLVSAETRGNGAVGEDIYHNAKVINSIPKVIDYKEELIVDGEIICKKNDFQKFAGEYANPRNFAAGSIRLLDSKECAKRRLTFVAWDVIQGFPNVKTVNGKLTMLDNYGFITVPRSSYPALYLDETPVTIEDIFDHLTETAKAYEYPIDGLVVKYQDIEYGKSLGATEHHFRNAMAYKFADETYTTQLQNIEWTMGRTGVLTPIAIFNPIEMDDSVVERASLHNVSIMEQLLGEPYKGQPIEVFKANMIIPQVKSAVKGDNTCLLDLIKTPTTCPICGKQTYINTNNDVKIRVCGNAECAGKLINRLDHFCGKKGLDIKGLSVATLEKLVEKEWLNNLIDVFYLKNYRDEWVKLPGFGAKSVDKILNAIEEAKNTTLDKFICAIGIPLIGTTASKKLVQVYPTWKAFMDSLILFDRYDEIEGFGPEMDKAITNFDYREAEKIAEILTFEKNNDIIISESEIKDKTFVITGSLKHYKNRDELKKVIESHGGKVVGSVSSKTSYLINNDVNSTSSKNVSAKKYNVPILSEEDFIKMLG